MFVIYVPGAHGFRDEQLDAVGLASLHGDNAPAVNWLEVKGTGPDSAFGGGSGMLAFWGDAIPTQHQAFEWQAAAPAAAQQVAGGRYWMGKPRGEPITPAMLARPRQYEGELVKLDDGQEWRMPIARELPRRWKINRATGEDDWEIDEAYAQFVDDANHAFHESVSIFEQIDAGKSPAEVHAQIDSKRLVRLACAGLGLNYLLTRDLIDWLGLVRRFETWFWLGGAPWELKTRAAIAAEKKTADAIPAS